VTVKWSRENFIEDYQFLRSQGCDHQQIAHSMGLSLKKVDQKVRIYGCRRLEPSERLCYDRIVKLARSGERFSFLDMPFDVDRRSFGVAVRLAVGEGLVVECGWVRGLVLLPENVRRVMVFRGVGNV